jgi:hypothetical protein
MAPRGLPREGAGRLSRRRYSCAGGRPAGLETKSEDRGVVWGKFPSWLSAARVLVPKDIRGFYLCLEFEWSLVIAVLILVVRCTLAENRRSQIVHTERRERGRGQSTEDHSRNPREQ